MIFFVLPVAFALDNCKEIIEPSDVPCRIVSPWEYTSCANHTNIVYNSSGYNILNYTFQDYGSTGLCQFIWNITTKGSYALKTDLGDTGNIIVQDDNMQLALVLALGITIASLLALAFKLEEQHFVLRLLSGFFAIICMGLVPAVFLISNLATIFYRLILGFIILFWVYVVMVVGYWVLLKIGLIIPKKNG